ncbi:MAG: porin, partial [Pseudomonadota bacterium]
FGLGDAYPNKPQSTCPPPPASTGTGVFCGGTLSADFGAIFFTATAAYEVLPNLWLGVSPIGAFTRFKLQGAEFFSAASSDPSNVSNNGWDTAWGQGLQLGIHYDPGPFAVGASWQSVIDMDSFGDYAGIIADRGNLDLPAVWRLGLAVPVTERLDVAIDVEHVQYSKVEGLSNEFVNPLVPGNTLLGEPGATGFGWNDNTTLQVGAQYDVTGALTLRAGYAISNEIVPEDQLLFSVVAPGSMRQHYAAGFGVKFSDSLMLDFGASWSPAEEVEGPNNLSPDQQLLIALDSLELALGLSWRY